MKRFEGKVVGVTGAASGIGLELSKLLAREGAILSLADNRKDALENAVTEIEVAAEKVLTTVVDVRKSQDVNPWITQTIDKFGSLDGAANLAGVIGASMGTKTIADSDDDGEWEFVMAVNCTGVFNCLRAELKAMKSGASIVNAASIAGLMGVPRSASYSASKHAVVGLTKTAAKEAGSRNIRVNAVAPGVVRTPMMDVLDKQQGPFPKSAIPLGREATPLEIANLAAFLLSDESSFITGAIYTIDGGRMS